MTTILVTGGAGFIGSNFVHYMTQKYPEYNIIVLDTLTYAGSVDNLPPEFEGNRIAGREFWYGDVTNTDLVDSLVQLSDFVVHFAAESVASDTLIPLHKGHSVEISKIEDLFSTLSKRNKVETNLDGVEMIKVPKFIRTIGYSNGMGSWKQIKYITRHKYHGDMFNLRQKWGEITVTPNHSIYAANGSLVRPEENLELLTVRKIDWDKTRLRDSITVKYKNGVQDGGRLFAKNTNNTMIKSTSILRVIEKDNLKKLVKFLGFYCAEGSSSFINQDKMHSNRSYGITLSNKRQDLLEELKNDMKDICDASGNICKTQTCFQLCYSSKILYNLLRRWCGVGSGNKKVPDFIFTLSSEYQELFLEWYLLGDGNQQKYVNTSSWRAASTSKLLITGLGFLCTNLGKDYTLGYRKEGNDGKWKESYSIKLVWSYGSEELKKEIKVIPYDGYVYDLTVEDTENFCSGMGLVAAHNTHVTRSIFDNKLFFMTDVIGTQTIANAVCRHKNKVQRLIHISTSEVYGTAVAERMDENHPLNPASPYAAAKVGADRLVYSYWSTYKIPIVIVRPFNNYGPRQHLEKAVPRFITSLLLQEQLHLHGDGSAARDFVYVDDTCSALDLIIHADSDKVVGEVFNVGTGVDRSIKSIADDIITLFGGGSYTCIGDRPGQVVRHTADINKISTRLGWSPQINWIDGLKQTIDWYNKNGSIWMKQKWLREIPIISASGIREMH